MMINTAKSYAIWFLNLPFWKTALILVAGGAGATMGGWASDREPPNTILSARALETSIAPGGILRVRYEMERHRSCPVQIDRVLFDGDGVRYNLDDLSYAASPGPMGRDSYTVAIPLPKSFAIGPGVYRVVTRYECNVLQKWWPIIARGEVHFNVVSY